MSKEKYILIKAGRLNINRTKASCNFYRIQALRDIPEHGVKEGDFGGYVTSKYNLSHEGSCWIADKAQVYGNVIISEDAYVGGNAVVVCSAAPFFGSKPDKKESEMIVLIRENAIILGNATVSANYEKGINYAGERVIEGKVNIDGDAIIELGEIIKDDVKIYGSAQIHLAKSITGRSEIFDNVVVHKGSIIHDSILTGDLYLPENSVIHNGVWGKEPVDVSQYITEDTSYLKDPLETTRWEIFTGKTVPASQVAQEIEVSAGSKLDVGFFNELCEAIESYQTDIVKIIKYPVMVDKTNSYTLELMIALNAAKRLVTSPESQEFKEAVGVLERAFLMAESNAQKIASSSLSDAEKKKTEKAKDLFRIASNDASSEQEKKVAFIQGFKQLEGVIAVPEVAVDTFRVKLGLLELESGF